MNTFGHGWGMGFGWFIPLLVLAAIYYLLQGKKETTFTAQDILDKRYASGGISKEEYEEKSRHLKNHA